MKKALVAGGSVSELRTSRSSTSKLLVSHGELTSGTYGAVESRIVSQSMSANQGWFCVEKRPKINVIY